MLVNKRMLKLADLCLRKDGGALSGLFLDRGRVIASNGKYLVVGDFITPPEEDFPEMEEIENGKEFSVILPYKGAEQLAKKIPKSKGLPRLKHVKLNVKDGKIKVGCSDLETKSIEEIRVCMEESNYPKYRNLFEELKERRVLAEVVVNPELLIELLRHFSLTKNQPSVKISIYEDKEGETTTSKPIKLHAKNYEVGEIEGLLMPLSLVS